MLTADHVRARKKNGELIVRTLEPRELHRARELAVAYLDIARSCVSRTRDELEEAWAAVPLAPRDRKLADGLQKLIEDAAEFAVGATVDPIALRSDLFLAASAARRVLDVADRFERDAVVGEVASSHGLDAAGLERTLYADLKGEQILTALGPVLPDTLVERYDGGQVQAVLLRAVRVTADVACATPAAYRALFRELKFRRLMHRIERREAGYRIEIDGPYSLFESVTKYGLELALVLPALEACDSLALEAHIRWGKAREPLVMRYQKKGQGSARGTGKPAPRLRDDVATLAEAFASQPSDWRVAENEELLDVPGVGVCVPDPVFEQLGTRRRVYLEALGFWNRDAVWKRIELVQQGLTAPILFAASSRLRVTEALLDDAETAALYVYKGVMSPRAVLKKLDALAAR